MHCFCFVFISEGSGRMGDLQVALNRKFVARLSSSYVLRLTFLVSEQSISSLALVQLTLAGLAV